MKDELDTLSDAKLNEVFAVEVDGVELSMHEGKLCRVTRRTAAGDTMVIDVDDYCTDASTALRFVDGLTWERSREGDVWIWGTNMEAYGAETGKLARDICIALIRMRRESKP